MLHCGVSSPLVQTGLKQPASILRWNVSTGGCALVAVSLLLPPWACWVLTLKRLYR